jgi:hypothetical protein
VIDYSSPTANLTEGLLARVQLPYCWTGSVRYVSDFEVVTPNGSDERHTDLTWTILEPAVGDPDHYLASVTGTYSHSEVYVYEVGTPNGIVACKTVTTYSGTADARNTMHVYVQGAGMQVATPPLPTLLATGTAVHTGPSPCPQGTDAVTVPYHQVFNCAGDAGFLDTTVSIDAFDGEATLADTEQCVATAAWSFVRE